jgi:threonine/homoserine/homoserine lactone efflux protein
LEATENQTYIFKIIFLNTFATMALIEGFLFGLGTVIFFGPVFFTLLNATLQYGYKGGLTVTAGIVTSDLICALVSTLATPFVDHPTTKFWLAVAGSIVLIVMGIKYLVKPIQYQQVELNLRPKQFFGFFSKGFIVNITSPFTCVYWLGVEAYGIKEYPSTNPFIIYVGSVILAIFLIDVLKVALSKQLYKLLQPKTLRKISIVTGIVLLGFTVRLIFYAVNHRPG